jgi:hypothetical protein
MKFSLLAWMKLMDANLGKGHLTAKKRKIQPKKIFSNRSDREKRRKRMRRL